MTPAGGARPAVLAAALLLLGPAALVLGTPGIAGPAMALGAAGTAEDPPPPAPEAVEAVPLGPETIEVAWSAVTEAEEGVQHYNVYRDGKKIAETGNLLYTDGGLSPSTEYTYRISAVDGKGREGKKSDPARATTLSSVSDDDDDDDDDDDEKDDEDENDDDDGTNDDDDGTNDDDDGTNDDDDGGGSSGSGDRDTSAPSAPDGLRSDVVSHTRVELSWSRAQDPESGISAYRVYRDGSRIAQISGTSFRDEEVEPRTTYRYEVSAVNGQGLEGARSQAVEVTTPRPAHVPPAPPTRLRIVP